MNDGILNESYYLPASVTARIIDVLQVKESAPGSVKKLLSAYIKVTPRILQLRVVVRKFTKVCPPACAFVLRINN